MDTPSCCNLVTGASSGIGLAFTRHLLDASDLPVVAVSRHACDCDELDALAGDHGRLIRIDADLADEDDLDALARQLEGAGLSVSRVINCAGMLHQPASRGLPEKRIEDVRKATLMDSFAINAFTPILLAKYLLPLMPRGQQTVFASLSARVGSISDNHLGGWYAYRASKAAQNQLLRTLAIEAQRRWPNVRVLILHPGTTDTPLSAPFQSRVPEDKLFDANWVAARLLQIIEQTDVNDSGRFIDWQGKDIPW